MRMHSRNESVGTLLRVAEACLPHKATAILTLIGFHEAPVHTLSCLHTILHPACLQLCRGQNCRHCAKARNHRYLSQPGGCGRLDSLSIAFQMKDKHPVSPCNCHGSLRPKLQQRMLQCGSAGAGWVAGRRSQQQVCRKLGTTVAPHDPASTKATGRPLECPQSALSGREKGSALQMEPRTKGHFTQCVVSPKAPSVSDLCGYLKDCHKKQYEAKGSPLKAVLAPRNWRELCLRPGQTPLPHSTQGLG